MLRKHFAVRSRPRDRCGLPPAIGAVDPGALTVDVEAGVIWRDRSKDVSNCIRITVGSAEENNATLEVLSRV